MNDYSSYEYCSVCRIEKPTIYTLELNYNNYEIVCLECYKEFKRCDVCKKKYHEDDVVLNDNTLEYCESCLDSKIEDEREE